MGYVFDFTPHSFKVKLQNGEVIEFKCEPPEEYDYDIVKKIWEWK